jgi:hypothetical protein
MASRNLLLKATLIVQIEYLLDVEKAIPKCLRSQIVTLNKPGEIHSKCQPHAFSPPLTLLDLSDQSENRCAIVFVPTQTNPAPDMTQYKCGTSDRMQRTLTWTYSCASSGLYSPVDMFSARRQAVK